MGRRLPQQARRTSSRFDFPSTIGANHQQGLGAPGSAQLRRSCESVAAPGGAGRMGLGGIAVRSSVSRSDSFFMSGFQVAVRACLAQLDRASDAGSEGRVRISMLVSLHPPRRSSQGRVHRPGSRPDPQGIHSVLQGLESFRWGRHRHTCQALEFLLQPAQTGCETRTEKHAELLGSPGEAPASRGLALSCLITGARPQIPPDAGPDHGCFSCQALRCSTRPRRLLVSVLFPAKGSASALSSPTSERRHC